MEHHILSDFLVHFEQKAMFKDFKEYPEYIFDRRLGLQSGLNACNQI